MIVGGVGGANTQTGLWFEKDTDLKSALLAKQGVTIRGADVYYNGILVGHILQKHSLYKDFLEKKGINWQQILSKKLLPDEAYYSIRNNRLVIVEKKWQQVEGSVDEKLQTCDFKKRQYEKLCNPVNIEVEYVYVLNDWFKDARYKDVLEYINTVGCHYFFSQLPFDLFDIS